MRLRHPLALLVALVLATGAACGGGDDGGPTGDGGGDDRVVGARAAGADPDAFPVEIAHRHGTTTIEEPPERIVTVGLTDQDPLLALGVVPVGTTEWFGEHPGALWPWAADRLGDAPAPEVVGDADGLNPEAIARLRPDLVLAVYGGLTAGEYETLSAIAPTVAQPDEYADFAVPWQAQTEIIGRAVGQEDEAAALVADLEDRFAAAAAEHPEFQGAVGAMATSYQGAVWAYAPTDVRGRFLDALGFAAIEGLDDLSGEEFGATISLERLDMIDVDALVWIVDDVEGDMARLHDEPLYDALAVGREGREVPVANESELGGATSFQTVLSLPVLLDGLVPMLAAAVDGDPATAVEQPA